MSNHFPKDTGNQMNIQPDIDAYKHFANEAKKYGENYEADNLLKVYPHHLYRLNIFMGLLDSIKPRRVLDVGCGSGEPLCAFLLKGHDAYGFDYSEEMVGQARQLLLANNLDQGRVTQNNMDDLTNISPNEYDCIVGLGSLYYSRNFQGAIGRITELLPKGGHLIFSLRNELFSLFSMNKYTVDFFLRNLVPSAKLSPDLNARLTGYLDERLRPADVAKKFLTTDEKKVFSLYHNPLTVEKEVLAPHGLLLKGLYYYHYHALPPEFEHSNMEEFRRLSRELENPTDWRGMFMCSTFVVHAVKG